MTDRNTKTATDQNIDKVSEQLLKYAAFLRTLGATQEVITAAFFRSAMTIMIVDLGIRPAIENLELASLTLQENAASYPRTTKPAPRPN